MLYSRSIRDSAVSLSSAEAELRALKELTQDIIWFRLLLSELLFPQPTPTIAYEDNSAAYLEAPIDTITFVRLPDSHPTQPNDVVQLKKSLYGLASSGLNWNRTIHAYLISYSFTRSVANPCVYIKLDPTSGDIMYLALYVDDFLVAGSCPQVLDHLETYLKTCVQELLISPLAKFLGISISRDRSNRTISLL